MNTLKFWRIDITSWGTCWAFGTEREAEEWRAHKARWEGSFGKKIEVQKTELPVGNKWFYLQGQIDISTKQAEAIANTVKAAV